MCTRIECHRWEGGAIVKRKTRITISTATNWFNGPFPGQPRCFKLTRCIIIKIDIISTLHSENYLCMTYYVNHTSLQLTYITLIMPPQYTKTVTICLLRRHRYSNIIAILWLYNPLAQKPILTAYLWAPLDPDSCLNSSSTKFRLRLNTKLPTIREQPPE